MQPQVTYIALLDSPFVPGTRCLLVEDISEEWGKFEGRCAVSEQLRIVLCRKNNFLTFTHLMDAEERLREDQFPDFFIFDDFTTSG